MESAQQLYYKGSNERDGYGHEDRAKEKNVYLLEQADEPPRAQEGKEAEKVNLARSVRERRRAAGLTQKELAEKCGVAASFIAQIETGRKLPSLYCAVDMAKALECELTDLIGGGNESDV